MKANQFQKKWWSVLVSSGLAASLVTACTSTPKPEEVQENPQNSGTIYGELENEYENYPWAAQTATPQTNAFEQEMSQSPWESKQNQSRQASSSVTSSQGQSRKARIASSGKSASGRQLNIKKVSKKTAPSTGKSGQRSSAQRRR